MTCRASKYRIQLLFSPVRIFCCLTALLRASYDLRAIWKHSNHRLPNRVSHHLHLVKGLVFQSSFLQLLRKDASQQVTGTSNRRGRAKRQRTISLDSIRMIQMHICIYYVLALRLSTGLGPSCCQDGLESCWKEGPLVVQHTPAAWTVDLKEL